MMYFARNILDGINRISEWICCVLLVVLVGITVFQVFLRYVLKSPVSWSEEVALLLLVWFGMLAVAIGVFRHTHMAITALWDYFPPPLKYIVNILIELFIIIFALNIGLNAEILIDIVGDQTLSASELPKAWLYFPLQFGGGLMVLNSVGNILLDHFPDDNITPSNFEM
jgi:TRAP-type C4-dicarboxylate transport system permease small subunit